MKHVVADFLLLRLNSCLRDMWMVFLTAPGSVLQVVVLGYNSFKALLCGERVCASDSFLPVNQTGTVEVGFTALFL